MGRKRVLSDFQREKRKYKSVVEWREKNRDQYNAYMREFNKRNDQAAYMRAYRTRKRLVMFQDAFERVMDRKDGFNDDLIKKEKIKAYQRDRYHRIKVLNPRVKLTDEERKLRRKASIKKYCQKWWAKNKERCIEERKPYHKEWREKNAEKIRTYQREWYQRKKQKLRTPCVRA